MAVDIPQPRVVGIELHRNTRLAGDQHSISDWPGEPAIVDRNHLKRMSVKVYGMRHRRFIDEFERHPLARLHMNLRLLASGIADVKRNIVDQPFIATHVALQAQDTGLICRLRGERIRGSELAFLFQSQQAGRSRARSWQFRYPGARCRQDDARPLRRKLAQSQDLGTRLRQAADARSHRFAAQSQAESDCHEGV